MIMIIIIVIVMMMMTGSDNGDIRCWFHDDDAKLR